MQNWIQSIDFVMMGRFHDGFAWNPSTRECECDKSCDFGEKLNFGESGEKCWLIS